jgi:hypothetical protein
MVTVMRKMRTTEPVVVGLVIDQPRQGYRVERVVMDEPGWAIVVMAKTRGTYAGNHVLIEITKEGKTEDA